MVDVTCKYILCLGSFFCFIFILINFLLKVRLPNVNKIICVDDMPIEGLKSTISWRYLTRRAIINLRLLPLVEKNVTMVEKNDSAKQLKCYLEYLNECTKCFCIVKEFTIEEGNYTNGVLYLI